MVKVKFILKECIIASVKPYSLEKKDRQVVRTYISQQASMLLLP